MRCRHYTYLLSPSFISLSWIFSTLFAPLFLPGLPGTLHYGMHAYDFAGQVAAGGLKYARNYPKYVTKSSHSLHMPAHIFDRNGLFRLAAWSNNMSVNAADAFATSGAFHHRHQPSPSISSPSIESPSLNQLPFHWDAGNRYHSLEYQQYELLSTCQFTQARRLLQRMNHASQQALRHLSLKRGQQLTFMSVGRTEFERQVGEAWYEATTYQQWSYRMFARQVQFSWLLDSIPYGISSIFEEKKTPTTTSTQVCL